LPWDPSALCGAGTDINNLIIGDLSPDGVNLFEPDTITRKLGRRLNANEMSSLRTAISDSHTLIKKNFTPEDGIGLNDFLVRFKKGSKPFRKVLDKMEADKIRGRQNKRVKTFFELVSVEKPEQQYVEKLLAQWALPFYNVGFREFILKFRFNILGINTRVAHFNNNVSRACTICTLARRGAVGGLDPGPLPVPAPIRLVPVPIPARPRNPQIIPQLHANVHDETFVHLFFDCKFTKDVLKKFNEKFFMIDFDSHFKKFIFTGIIPGITKPNSFLMTMASAITYYIWQCKLQKKSPSFEGLNNDIFFNVENMLRCNMNLRIDMDLNLPLCRSWKDEAARRR
jgi:hypothetical protein